MRYQFVAAERASYPVRLLCRVVGVAASGFYAWLQRGPSRRERQDRSLAERIAAVFAASRRTYGSPRFHADLRAEGVRVSRKRDESARVQLQTRQRHRHRTLLDPESGSQP